MLFVILGYFSMCEFLFFLFSTIEGEETHGCQISGAAKLDTDAGFYPKRHCWSISKRSEPYRLV